jgi:hypothetical protein
LEIKDVNFFDLAFLQRVSYYEDTMSDRVAYQPKEEDFFISPKSSLRVGRGGLALCCDGRSGTQLLDQLEKGSALNLPQYNVCLVLPS